MRREMCITLHGVCVFVCVRTRWFLLRGRDHFAGRSDSQRRWPGAPELSTLISTDREERESATGVSYLEFDVARRVRLREFR